MRNDPRRREIKLSIIDRIIGPESAVRSLNSAQSTARMYGSGLAELEYTVRLDLNDLLNTRRAHQAISNEFPNAAKSLLVFGLPDFSDYDPADSSDREKIRQEIQRTIELFESRLSNVTVSLDRSKKEEP